VAGSREFVVEFDLGQLGLDDDRSLRLQQR
jgi:hypothetical protein